MSRQRAFLSGAAVLATVLFLGGSEVWAQRGGVYRGGGGVRPGGAYGGGVGVRPGGAHGGAAVSPGHIYRGSIGVQPGAAYHRGAAYPSVLYRGGVGVAPNAGLRPGVYPGISSTGLYRPYGSFYGLNRGVYSSIYGGYGSYRPYYGYGYRPGVGVGIGIGIYAPYYGSTVYAPTYQSYSYSVPSVTYSVVPPLGGTEPAPPEDQKPAPDNAVHLQLKVPEGAEVYFDGTRTKQNGTTREFTSPPLTPGKQYTYRISVRYTGPDGKQVNDTRDIRVRPNDWFAIDFTRPAPPEQPADRPKGQDR